MATPKEPTDSTKPASLDAQGDGRKDDKIPDPPASESQPEDVTPEIEAIAPRLPTEDKPAARPEGEAASKAETRVPQATKAAPGVVSGPSRRGPGFTPLFLGGIVAAVIGFGAARYVIPQGWPLGPAPSATAEIPKWGSDLTASVQTLQAALSDAQLRAKALSDKIASAEIQNQSISEKVTALAMDLEGRDSATKKALADLSARLDGLPKAPAATEAAVPGNDQAAQALRAMIDQLTAQNAALAKDIKAVSDQANARIDAAEKQAEAVKADAEAAAKKARVRGAMANLNAALDAGGPLAPALADLSTEGIAAPPALTAAADKGVPTLGALQRAFPNAARTALAASIKETMGNSLTERLTAFFRSQTQARSLTPRAGSDPDAVLSRAEAAVRENRLADALTELAGLPDKGRAAMADWEALARQRIDALDAAKALTAANGK